MSEPTLGHDKSTQTAKRRGRILEGAMRVFLKQGVGATRMEQVAEACGLSIGGLYWHYESKRALILDTLRGLFEPDLETLMELAQLPGSTRERIERCLVRTIAEDHRTQPVVQEVYCMAHRDDEIATWLASYFGAYETLFTRILEEGIAAGDVRPANARSAATALLSAYEGAIQLGCLLKIDEDPTVWVLRAIRHVLDGITVG